MPPKGTVVRFSNISANSVYLFISDNKREGVVIRWKEDLGYSFSRDPVHIRLLDLLLQNSLIIIFLLLRIDFYHIMCPDYDSISSMLPGFTLPPLPSKPPPFSLSLENKQVRLQLHREDQGVGEQLPRWTDQF